MAKILFKRQSKLSVLWKRLVRWFRSLKWDEASEYTLNVFVSIFVYGCWLLGTIVLIMLLTGIVSFCF